MFTKEQLTRSLIVDGLGDGTRLQSGDFKTLHAWFKSHGRNAYDANDRAQLRSALLTARKSTKPTAPTQTRQGDIVTIGSQPNANARGYINGFELSAAQLRGIMSTPRGLMRCRSMAEIIANPIREIH